MPSVFNTMFLMYFVHYNLMMRDIYYNVVWDLLYVRSTESSVPLATLQTQNYEQYKAYTFDWTPRAVLSDYVLLPREGVRLGFKISRLVRSRSWAYSKELVLTAASRDGIDSR